MTSIWLMDVLTAQYCARKRVFVRSIHHQYQANTRAPPPIRWRQPSCDDDEHCPARF